MNDDVPNELTITVPVPDDVQDEVRDRVEDNPDAEPDDLLVDRFSWEWKTGE